MSFRRFLSLLPDKASCDAAGAGRRQRSHAMTRYLISFPGSAMNHIPDEEFPAVGKAAHAVVQEAMDAGVWVFGGGLAEDVDPVMVAEDGTVTAGSYPKTRECDGGFTGLDLPAGAAAVEWAASIDA